MYRSLWHNKLTFHVMDLSEKLDQNLLLNMGWAREAEV